MTNKLHKILNLTEDFNPWDGEKRSLLEYKYLVFSGGEPHININLAEDDTDDVTDIFVTIRINDYRDMGKLKVAMYALRAALTDVQYHLFLPYMPGARQDRITEDGEALTVKMYADDINSLEFNTVKIFDPHSDVSVALIDNVSPINNHDFVRECMGSIYDWDSIVGDEAYLVSPDAGANKKIHKLAQDLEHTRILKCDKKRDTATGALSGFEVYEDNLGLRDCIIVDDICDGGGTFIGLAEELRRKNAGKLYLIVSHGIFSRGYNALQDYFAKIYTTDSIKSRHYYDSTENPRQGVSPSGLEVIKLKDIIC